MLASMDVVAPLAGASSAAGKARKPDAKVFKFGLIPTSMAGAFLHPLSKAGDGAPACKVMEVGRGSVKASGSRGGQAT